MGCEKVQIPVDGCGKRALGFGGRVALFRGCQTQGSRDGQKTPLDDREAFRPQGLKPQQAVPLLYAD
jgi:hypothetical protein